MSRKFLYTFVILLVVLNIALLFLLIKPTGGFEPKHAFLTEELQFTDAQIESFRLLDRSHRATMRSFDRNIRQLKDQLFQSFSDTLTDPKSIARDIGDLEVKKDLELYRFFTEVRKICTPEQVQKFDKIISQALKGGPKGPPQQRRPPPH